MGFGSRMKHTVTRVFIAALAILGLPHSVGANTSVHTSWLWHLHQPIYWPDQSPGNHATDHYQNAYDTLQFGNGHPSDTSLTDVFSLPDRLHAYQEQPNVTLNSFSYLANSGAQVNYSGALMENVQSLAAHGMWYGGNWNTYNQTARTWTTTGGKPRLDLTGFTYHHAIAPFVSDETLEMDIRIHQRHQQIIWNAPNAQVSRGFFPAETCFSEHIIPVLNKLGITWSVVANNHLSRSCADFPYVAGSGGENCDIPNRADQLNPAAGASNYQRLSIDRGVSPAAAMPFAFQMHYARYVDPATGSAWTTIVVPADQALGWKDSYSTWDVGLIAPIAARNNPSKPCFVLLAHDGDNAWSGGNSYYNEWAKQFADTAVSSGYEPSTVEQFLSEFPPSPSDVVHVEDGGWEFADSDFGSPIMINWHWPPSIANSNPNVVDPSAGISDKADVWRVHIATENRVKTAQQIQNTLTGYTNRIDQIRDPGSFSQTPSAVELGWHYYLGGLDSGFVYYGCHADECWRPVLAQSNACRNVDSILNANPSVDTTPPTVFIPQRHPWNPGTTNFGVQYSYKQFVPTNTDFWVWTYAYDVSGIANVTLLYRSNGSNSPPTQDEFKTYAGGPDTGSWISQAMTLRSVAPQNTVLPPKYIADYYYSKVTGLADTYVDYYVSATDNQGNAYNSPIQHVYVSPTPTGGGGGGGGSTNGCNGRVCVSPAPPVANNSVTIRYTPSGGPIAGAGQVYIHLGWNNWNPVISPDAAMTFDSISNVWVYSTAVPGTATQLDCVFNNGAGTWDNNSGQDWHFTVSSVPQPPPTPGNVTATPVSPTQISVNWAASSGATGYIVERDGSPIATTSGTSYMDSGLVNGSTYCYKLVATNSVGNSAESSATCATISGPPTPQNLTATAVATNQINLTWSASTGAAGYIVDRNGTPIATTSATSYNNLGLAPNTTYCYTISATNGIGSSAFSSSVCATTLSAPPVTIPFVLNTSSNNYPGYLLSSPGMTLYAAVRGTTLYVATWSPGTNGPNDHFVLVSDQILASPTTAAPWAKVGSVAVPATKVMLAGESQGTYVGWQTITGSSVSISNQAVKSATNAGQMQGTIDLVQAFGSVPSTLYLCALAYNTTNGGALAVSGQAPGPVVTNLNIEASEFLAVPVVSIADNNGDGVFDRLDPNSGFVIQSVLQPVASGFTITWPAIPGLTYQVMACDSFDSGWTNIATVTATNGQGSLSYTDISATNAVQRFYKVKH